MCGIALEIFVQVLELEHFKNNVEQTEQMVHALSGHVRDLVTRFRDTHVGLPTGEPSKPSRDSCVGLPTGDPARHSPFCTPFRPPPTHPTMHHEGEAASFGGQSRVPKYHVQAESNLFGSEAFTPETRRVRDDQHVASVTTIAGQSLKLHGTHCIIPSQSESGWTPCMGN